MRTPSRRRAATAAAAAVVLAAAAPPAATADSIAYVRDGDVWLATPDGARHHRVTLGGAYADVTQADDGTLVALSGVRLHRLSRAGALLADFDTPVSDTRPPAERVFHGPFDPALSPDGTRLSYTYYYVGKGTAPGCTPPTCMTTVTEGGTAYSHADRQTAWDEPGLGRHSGWRHATWVDDRTTLISNPTHLPNHDVLLDVVGDQGVPIMEWFSDTGTPHVGAGELSRQRTKLAFQAGEGDVAIRVYRAPGAFPALPEACFEYSGSGAVGAPTWAPDGARLAWADGDGVKVAEIPSFASGCTTTGASPAGRVVAPGGAEPDWGPADVPPGPGRVPDDGDGDGDGPSDGGRAPGGDRTVPGTKRVSARVTAATARGGVRLSVRVPGRGRLAATATPQRGRAVVLASAPAVSVRAAGRRGLVLRLTPAGRRAVARAGARGRVRLRVRVTFTAAAGARSATVVTATVKGGKR